MADDDCQNPLYPQDAALTVPEMEAMARACSLMRAQSPGELVCIIDNTSSDDVPVIEHDLVHNYAELMAYRYENVIADDAPWTYWTLADVWAALQPAELPPPRGPPPPNGWQWQARVNPEGISETDGHWSPYYSSPITFAVRIDPSVVLLPEPGLETRVLLSAGPSWISGATISDVYIGPIGSGPWVASELFHLTFNGGANAAGFWLDQFTDAIPLGIDASPGLLVSFCVQGGVVGGREIAPGWSTQSQAGNHSADLDKSGTAWTPTAPSVGLLTVDGYYVAATSDLSALEANDYLLGAGAGGAPGLAFSRGHHHRGHQQQSRAGALPRHVGRRAVGGAAGRAPLWRPGRYPRRR